MNKEQLREYLNKDIETLRSLNFSEVYIKSVMENTSKWAGTGLLSGIADPHIGRNVAALLENQRIFNEQWPGKNNQLVPEGAETDMPIENWAAQWRRVSIPVIRRAFAENFIGHQIVSVQTMKSGQENTYLIGFDGRTIAGMTESHTRPLSAQWEHPTWQYDETGRLQWAEFRGQQYSMGLDAEAEATAIFSEAICNDFSREIIRDLTVNAGKKAVYEYKDGKHLLSLIEGMSAYIAAKCQNREATWVITRMRLSRPVALSRMFLDPDRPLPSPRRPQTRTSWMTAPASTRWAISCRRAKSPRAMICSTFSAR